MNKVGTLQLSEIPCMFLVVVRTWKGASEYDSCLYEEYFVIIPHNSFMYMAEKS